MRIDLKLILDGMLTQSSRNSFFEMQNYIPGITVAIQEDLTKEVALLAKDDSDRFSYYREVAEGTHKVFKKNISRYSDNIQLRSPLNIYAAERLFLSRYGIEDRDAKKEAERLLISLIKPYARIDSRMFIEIRDKAEPINISNFIDLVAGPKSIEFDLLTEYYCKGYDILRRLNKKMKVYKEGEDYIRKQIYDPIINQANKVKLTYPYTIVLDIDGVILDWEGDDILQPLRYLYVGAGQTEEYNKACWELISHLNAAKNISNIGRFIIDEIFRKNLKSFNLVILTARPKYEDMPFIKRLGQFLLTELSDIIKSKEIAFGINTNILANPSFYLGGSSMFKGLSMKILFERMTHKSGLYFIDDREKYVEAAKKSIINSESFSSKIQSTIREKKLGANKVYLFSNIRGRNND